jgi:hypothetical protein
VIVVSSVTTGVVVALVTVPPNPFAEAMEREVTVPPVVKKVASCDNVATPGVGVKGVERGYVAC